MLKRLFVRLMPFLVVAAAAFAVGVWSNSAPCIDLRPVPVNPRHCDPGTIIIVADGRKLLAQRIEDGGPTHVLRERFHAVLPGRRATH